MMLLRAFAAVTVIAALTANFAIADAIISTDFAGTTESGTTLQGVTYTTMGVTVPASEANLTVNNTNQAQGNGNLFTTGAANGSFAVANNTGNGGEWNFTIEFTTGADAIDLESFDFGWRNFGGNGGNQFALRNTEVTFDILSSGSSVISGPEVLITPIVNTGNGSGSVDPGSSGTQNSSIDLTGESLLANTTYELFIQAGDATTGGNNFGFDNITLEGTVVTSAVPEPSSALLVVGLGLACGMRRRR